MDKNMQQNNLPPGANQPLKPSTKIKRLMAALALVAILVAAAALLLMPAKKPGRQMPAKAYEKGPNNQSISDPKAFELPGSQAGTGMSFLVPPQYTLSFKSDSNDQVALADVIVKAQQHTYLGAIFGQSSPLSGGAQSMAAEYRKAFADQKSAAYKNYTDSIEQFTTQRISPLYDVKFSPIGPFSSANLTSAWVMDMTAAAKPVAVQNAPAGAPDQVKNPNLEDFKGQVIFAVGKSTLYYFAVYNTTYNWDNNSSQFAKVTSSLKVDQ